MISPSFFRKEPLELAEDLLGKVLRKRYIDAKQGSVWLAARVIETEAYYLEDKASHSSLGFTEKKKAMFMSPGTIYMYYSRGSDSLNFSALGEGNAVLIKSGYPFVDTQSPETNLKIMQRLNPLGKRKRPLDRLCSGQTLLCRSLDLKLEDWNQQNLDAQQFYLDDTDYRPEEIIQCPRLGITEGRDHHLLYRFIDKGYAKHATSNPLTKRNWVEGSHYKIHSRPP